MPSVNQLGDPEQPSHSPFRPGPCWAAGTPCLAPVPTTSIWGRPNVIAHAHCGLGAVHAKARFLAVTGMETTQDPKMPWARVTQHASAGT